MTEIRYSRAAIRTLRIIPANVSSLIRSKIAQYANDPGSLSNNVKQLRGRPGYRLRVGNWRVIFDENGDVLDVLEIGPRGDIYD